MTAIYVGQAEWRVVGGDPAAVLTTVLGSCVACCLWDPEAAVGGMNHFLLPEGRGGGLAAMSAGSTAMEVLINECLKAGAARERLRARLFGGGTKPYLAGFYAGATVLFAAAFFAAGAGVAAYAGLAVGALHLGWQVRTLNTGDPGNCLRLFRSNRDYGWILFAGLLLDCWLTAVN